MFPSLTHYSLLTLILSSDLYSNLDPRSLLSLAASDESIEVENGSVYRIMSVI